MTAMVHRDPGGLDGAYRRYADRLYAYCVSLLRDADAAADVVQETFLLASERAGQLREPDRLRPWLYAIARHECLRVVRSRRRSAPLDEAGDVAAEPVDATSAVQAAALVELVGAAAASLSGPDREVIELSVRQGLSPAEVGAVLGLSGNHAHARLSRARTQLHRALGALLVARTNRGGAGCAALAELVRGWDGRLTPLLRKRLSRHIDGCVACSASQRDQLQPAALLPAYAALAFVAAPELVQARPDAPALAPRSPGPRLGADGFPVPARRGRPALTGAAAVAVLLLVLGGGIAAIDAGRDTPLAAPSGPPPTAALGPGGSGRGLADPTTTLSAAPTGAAPTDGPHDDVPVPVPTTSAPRPGYVLAFTATVTALPPACEPGGYGFRVAVQATAPLAAATAAWRTSAVHRTTMTRTGSTASAKLSAVDAATATWWVELRATDGRTYTSPARAITHVCV